MRQLFLIVGGLGTAATLLISMHGKPPRNAVEQWAKDARQLSLELGP